MFPRKCSKCRQKKIELVQVPYTADLDHDGRSYTISISDLSVLRCENCQNIQIPDESDDRLHAELRKAAGLLTPEAIRQYRTALGLKQAEMADLLGISESTLSRWETGSQIQQRVMDNFLRTFFALPVVRFFLKKGIALPVRLDVMVELDLRGPDSPSPKQGVSQTSEVKVVVPGTVTDFAFAGLGAT
jgi:putative zinc finger/helix-turn-helix YgiT family protein